MLRIHWNLLNKSRRVAGVTQVYNEKWAMSSRGVGCCGMRKLNFTLLRLLCHVTLNEIAN